MAYPSLASSYQSVILATKHSPITRGTVHRYMFLQSKMRLVILFPAPWNSVPDSPSTCPSDIFCHTPFSDISLFTKYHIYSGTPHSKRVQKGPYALCLALDLYYVFQSVS